MDDNYLNTIFPSYYVTEDIEDDFNNVTLEIEPNQLYYLKMQLIYQQYFENQNSKFRQYLDNRFESLIGDIQKVVQSDNNKKFQYIKRKLKKYSELAIENSALLDPALQLAVFNGSLRLTDLVYRSSGNCWRISSSLTCQ